MWFSSWPEQVHTLSRWQKGWAQILYWSKLLLWSLGQGSEQTDWEEKEKGGREIDYVYLCREVDGIFFSLVQGDKKRRKRKESKPGKQVKEVTKKKYAGVDKEFISEEAAHHMQQQSVSSGGYVGDPQPVNSSPATQTKHVAPDNYVHGQFIVSCFSSSVERHCVHVHEIRDSLCTTFLIIVKLDQ